MHLLSLRAGATDASHRRNSTEMPSSLTAIARMNVSLSKPESRCSRSNSCSSSCSSLPSGIARLVPSSQPSTKNTSQ